MVDQELTYISVISSNINVFATFVAMKDKQVNDYIDVCFFMNEQALLLPKKM